MWVLAVDGANMVVERGEGVIRLWQGSDEARACFKIQGPAQWRSRLEKVKIVLAALESGMNGGSEGENISWCKERTSRRPAFRRKRM
jgi:hypothetical protein